MNNIVLEAKARLMTMQNMHHSGFKVIVLINLGIWVKIHKTSYVNS